jgi:hypothetical protein
VNVPKYPDVNLCGKRHGDENIRDMHLPGCVLSYTFDNEQKEDEILFQQDGAPSHIRHEVRVPRKSDLPNPLNGRRAPTRSPH